MAKKLAFDKLLFTVVVLLVGMGLVMVYSASAAIAQSRGDGVNPFLVKQSVAAGLGFLVMLAAMHFDHRVLKRPAVAYTVILGCLALLVGVLFGPELNDTRRWLFVSGLSIQPSELAKLGLVAFLAYQIERKQRRINQAEFLVPTIVITSIMAGLVLLQPDLSSALLLVGVAGILLFLAGLSWKVLGLAALGALPTAWFLVFAVPYRRERILGFLEPEADPLGRGFQALQSLISIGSGGTWGRGLGHGVQKLYFLPYPHSDFIYSIVGEELGLIGCLSVLALFCVLLWRSVKAGLHAPDDFGKYLAWGLGCLITFQALLHMSVATALLPTTGVPLPFLTYGGSSLVTSLAACGLLLNISQHG